MTSTAPVRTVDGTEYPMPGRWTIDPGHAEVGFVGRHFGLTKVRGRFTGVTGHAEVADNIADSALTVVINTATVNSGNDTRDDHLRSADLFDVEQYPQATFVSTGITVDEATGTLAGNLTIKDVTRPVALDVEYIGHARDPWGNDRAVFSASTTINREDWGLTWNMLLEAGGLLVSKEIRIEIEIELVRDQP
ncbi:MAG TPA: YceI family protein [Ilumatobacter sp.]|nr:YceI family protein [Ilumatobacter sp.]